MQNFTDSVAVAVVDHRNVLQGCGNKLKHFFAIVSNGKLKWESRWHDLNFRDKIHGIDVEGSRVLVYGGRYFAICEIKSKNLKIISQSKLSDVISSAKMTSNAYNLINAVTTYNVALQIELDKENKMKILRKSACEERSTLYCSHIRLGYTWTGTKIFGGTAFGEVLIWSPSQSGKSTISYRFSNPTGVLFSITTSPDLRQLFTTSDDRSVRFWSLNWGESATVQSHSLDFSCFGHLGRVFRSALVDMKSGQFLVSVGEDSRVCCWDMGGNLVFRKEIHGGPTLWNLAVDCLRQTIYVTTSNGGLEAIDFEEAAKQSNPLEIAKEAFHGNYPAKVRFLGPDRLVCVTNTNELMVLARPGSEWVATGSVKLDFKSTVLEVNKDHLVALGGLETVSVYNCQDGHETPSLSASSSRGAVSSLIRAVHWLDNGELVAVNDKGAGFVFNTSLEVTKKFQLPCKKRDTWSTSVLWMENHLIVGDRHGNLSAFLSPPEDDELILKGNLRNVHGKLGITHMKALESWFFKQKFITTGHDGAIRTLRLHPETGELEMMRGQRIPIKWVERSAGYLVMGFNDNHFTVFDRKKRRTVMKIDCGGGHRFWDFYQDHVSGSRFVYIKARHLQLVEVPMRDNLYGTLPNSSSNWHATSTNCVRALRENVFSGGEDGLIKIHRWERGTNSLKFVEEITLHISNIRALHLKPLFENPSCFLYSAGGRAQLCIHRLEWCGDEIEIKECVNYMLKSSDLARGRKEKRNVDFDPETRFMCVVECDSQIFTGCSDGFIRVFHFDETSHELSLQQTIWYGKCILHIFLLKFNKKKFIVSGATDGKINFFNLECPGSPCFTLSHHESGINSMLLEGCYPREGNTVWILTGGDDQGIVASEICIDFDSFEFSIKRSFSHPFRHTAQVTGIGKTRFSNKFISAGVDQRLLEHDVENLNETREISFTSVADVKGVASVHDHIIIVYGAGAELIRYAFPPSKIWKYK